MREGILTGNADCTRCDDVNTVGTITLMDLMSMFTWPRFAIAKSVAIPVNLWVLSNSLCKAFCRCVQLCDLYLYVRRRTSVRCWCRSIHTSSSLSTRSTTWKNTRALTSTKCLRTCEFWSPRIRKNSAMCFASGSWFYIFVETKILSIKMMSHSGMGAVHQL